MTVKIWYVNPCTEEVTARLIDVLNKITGKMVRPGTSISFGCIEKGYTIPESCYTKAYNTLEIAKSIYEAYKKGYDAAIVGCFSDPGLHEARSIVDIPVTGVCESSLLLASCLGAKFSVLVYNRQSKPRIKRIIESHGLDSRLASIRPLNITLTEARKLYDDPNRFINLFKEIGKDAIERDGAEVLIPGCTIFSAILTENKIYEIDGCPILDCVATAIKIAESLVDLKRAFGIKVSRSGLYATSPRWEEEIPILP